MTNTFSDNFRYIRMFLDTRRPEPTWDEHEVNRRKFGV